MLVSTVHIQPRTNSVSLTCRPQLILLWDVKWIALLLVSLFNWHLIINSAATPKLRRIVLRERKVKQILLIDYVFGMKRNSKFLKMNEYGMGDLIGSCLWVHMVWLNKKIFSSLEEGTTLQYKTLVVQFLNLLFTEFTLWKVSEYINMTNTTFRYGHLIRASRQCDINSSPLRL